MNWIRSIDQLFLEIATRSILIVSNNTTPFSISVITAILLLIIAVLPPHEAGALTGTLTIPGTGDSTTLLDTLGEHFERQHPGTSINIPAGIGSTGGIKMLVEERENLARIARPLLDKETTLGLTVVPFALSPIVFAVNVQANTLTDISVPEIIGIYSGAITTWSQLHVELDTIYPLTREDGDSSLLVLNKLIPGFADINAQNATVIYTTRATVQTLLRYKRTIAFVPLSATIGTDLRVLSIDTVAPTIQNVQAGRYKYVTTLSLVYKHKPSELEQAFIDFLTSPEGMEIVISNGAVPLS